MKTRNKKTIVWIAMVAAIVASWLPYFDIFNTLTWIGPLPLPLAWVLSANIILTACAAALYPLYFKPAHERLTDLAEQVEKS